eukprot:4552406-Prymnesium_polylepis.2
MLGRGFGWRRALLQPHVLAPARARTRLDERPQRADGPGLERHGEEARVVVRLGARRVEQPIAPRLEHALDAARADGERPLRVAPHPRLRVERRAGREHLSLRALVEDEALVELQLAVVARQRRAHGVLRRRDIEGALQRGRRRAQRVEVGDEAALRLLRLGVGDADEDGHAERAEEREEREAAAARLEDGQTKPVPYSETRAPYLETRAPYVETRAPYVETRAPYVETRAPYVETRAPYSETRAPYVETRAPYVETRAPY